MFLEKASTAMQYGGSGVAVYFGFTPDQWQVIGVIGGLAVAVAGLLVNVWFKAQHLKLARGGGVLDEV